MIAKLVGQYRKNPHLLVAWVFYFLMIILGSVKFLERTFIWTFNDKLLHFFAYAVLACLIFWGLRMPILQRLLGTLLTISVLGAIDEYIQEFTGRDPSFDDWLADMAGGILSLVFIFFIKLGVWVWRVHRTGNWRLALVRLVHPADQDEEV